MFQVLKLFFIILLSLSTAMALTTDEQQPIHIAANATQYNYKTGKNIYEGDVKITQGSTTLLAERVETQNNEHHKIEAAFAYGKNKLAEYSTIPKPGDALFKAKANVIKFYPPKSLIILEGNVMVTQGENSFQGQQIVYNIKDQTITAPELKGVRSTIVIQPD